MISKSIGNLSLHFSNTHGAFERGKEILINKTFKFWINEWKKTFKLNKVNIENLADSFYRNDFICSYVDSRTSEVVAVHLYSNWNINLLPAINHSYFEIFKTHGCDDFFRSRGFENLVSFEFMTLHKDWTKSFTDHSLAMVLTFVGLQVVNAIGADGAIAPVRKDNKLAKLGTSIGCQIIKDDIEIHNTPCCLMYLDPSAALKLQSSETWKVAENLFRKSNFNELISRPLIPNLHKKRELIA